MIPKRRRTMLRQTKNVIVSYQKAGIEKKSHTPTLTAYVELSLPAKKKKAVLICPGGAYVHVSAREGEPVAKKFVEMGFQAFVLDYSVAPDVWPTALLELAQAVCMVREHAEEWQVDPHQVFVCGFSAGGHLAASLGCFWNQPFVFSPLGKTAEEIRPDGILLSYPVITSGAFAHRDSFTNLIGETSDAWVKRYAPGSPAASLSEFLSLELQAGAQTPPVFLWHTAVDDLVPVENSLLFAMALHREGVPVELHIFPDGIHGISLATEETADWPEQIVPAAQVWVSLAGRWANDQK